MACTIYGLPDHLPGKYDSHRRATGERTLGHRDLRTGLVPGVAHCGGWQPGPCPLLAGGVASHWRLPEILPQPCRPTAHMAKREAASHEGRELPQASQLGPDSVGGSAVTLHGCLVRLTGGLGLRDTFSSCFSMYRPRRRNRWWCSHRPNRARATPTRITRKLLSQVNRHRYRSRSTLCKHALQNVFVT